MTTPPNAHATHVVVDGHDGYTFWAGFDGALFTQDTATRFAADRNAGMKPEHAAYRVFALVPAGPQPAGDSWAETQAALR